MKERRYAQNTKVLVSRSQAELERSVSRYGASAFMVGWEGDEATVGFRINNLAIRFNLAHSQDERETRRLWRALVMVVKAKLEAVASDISTLEQEFLAWVVMPDGTTIGQRIVPQLANLDEHAMSLPLLARTGA